MMVTIITTHAHTFTWHRSGADPRDLRIGAAPLPEAESTTTHHLFSNLLNALPRTKLVGKNDFGLQPCGLVLPATTLKVRTQ